MTPAHIDALIARDRRAASHRDRHHPHPPRPQPRLAAAEGGDRRADHRLRAARARRSSARAPMRRSTATMRPIGCWPMASGRGRGLDADRGRDAGPHLQPSLLRAARDQGVVHRRSCDGLVDQHRLAAGWRHGRLYGQPRQADAARRPHLLSGAWRSGRHAAPAGARHDRPPQAARGADPAAAPRSSRRDPRDGRAHVCRDRPAALPRRRAIGAGPSDRSARPRAGRRARRCLGDLGLGNSG